MPKDADPLTLDDLACLALQAIIQRSASENHKARRTPEAMERHVADAYEYARLMMLERVTPTPR